MLDMGEEEEVEAVEVELEVHEEGVAQVGVGVVAPEVVITDRGTRTPRKARKARRTTIRRLHLRPRMSRPRNGM